jgi:hypothetical protein
MVNDEFVSSCGHTFDTEKMRQLWDVTLRRVAHTTRFVVWGR